ncbi:VWA domain-containing protein [Pseudotabrizicola algicola]|uniref:VWA domain-containing protein n=1 Tax=Pseudotabrizicola algicola TaxID=2709381 RepID=A0A6B3RU63_9RHOB|nr:VWA domain-containing protein [Pseudotabrizicola algicola]NEX46572.1 VWA domain-containing protein [Pseudotabrizicola algicola]
MTLKHLSAFCVGLFLAAPAFAQLPRTIIVMDGSGSMWGQIEGRAKLEIAQETVAQVLGNLPVDQEIGLMAYGHRERGNCADIELMVSPAPGTGAEIAAQVNKMRFQGKTPLTEAVRQAAEVLRSGEEAATVVLVTDGLETCEADPCALGRELEQSGLNFTAHVIGFGLTEEEGAQVACLADETGGLYLQAANAGALADALTRTVVAAPAPAPEPPPPPARTHFPGAERMPNIALSPTGFTVGDLTGDPAPPDFGADGTADQCAAACEADGLCAAWRYEPPGSLFVAEPRCFLYAASSEMDYAETNPGEGWQSGIKDGVLMLVRPYAPTREATARLTAPASAPQGSRIMVGWDGPRSSHDYIRVFDANGNWLAEVAPGEENPVELQLPWATGDFTLAYVHETEAISDSSPLVLTQAPMSITAPASAQVGQEVTITWVGPGAHLDNIQLLNADTGERWGYDYTDGKDSMVWTMPDVAGTYEFAYSFRDSEVIHTTPITVTLEPAEAAPEPTAPPPVQAVPVTFTGEGTGAYPLSITWSATPAPGQDLPPEAFAMNEGVSGTAAAEFLPGIYDVLGSAGDMVFAGQVTVSATGPNDFVIPVSANLGPAGPDTASVSVTITGPYMGTFRQWAAIPLPDGEVLRSDGEINDAWTVNLMPGQWLITATASGAEGEGLATVAEISGPGPIEVGQPTFGAAPFTDIAPFHRQCMGANPCTFHDKFSGLRMVLLPGWLMQDPYPLTTAAGEASVVSTLFGTTGTGDRPLAALNPRQWDTTLGPCEDTAAGQLCRMADMPGDALTGFRSLAATLRVTGAARPQTPLIEGTPLDLDADTATTLRNRLLGQP